MRILSDRSRLVSFAGAALFGVVVVGFIGCDSKEAESGQALAQVRGRLAALNSGGIVASPAALRERVYSDSADELRVIANSGDGPNAATANLLMGEISAGQASLLADEFRSVGRAMLSELAIADTRIDLFIGQHALAQALSGYDPAGEIAKLDELASARTNEHTQIRDVVTTREAEVQALLDDAAREKALAEQKRVEVGALRSQALRADAEERARLVVEAQGVQREREGHYKEAELLESQAARLEPELEAVRKDLHRVDLQLQALSEARELVRNDATALDTESSDALSAASDVGQVVVEALENVAALIEGDLAGRFGSTIEKYSAALRFVQKARQQDSDGAARVLGGTIDLSRASLLREHAANLERVARVLERAGSVSPTLPRAGDWAAQALAVQEQASKYRGQAKEAFGAAAEAIRRAGRGDLIEQAEAVAGRVEKLADLESDQTPDGESSGEAGSSGDEAAADEPANPDSEPE